MIKDVIVDITGAVQTDGEPEMMQFTTVGKLGARGGSWYVIYEEDRQQFAAGVKSTLKVEQNGLVTLQRSDGVTRLIVEQGQRHLCHYHTEYGDFMIGVFGEKVDSSFTEQGGKVYLRYTMDVNAGLASKNEVSITIREAGSQNVANH